MRNKIRCVILLVLSLSIFAHCSRKTWLAQGNHHATGKELPEGIEIDTKQVYFPASTMVHALYQVDQNKTITFFVAASIHANGWVSVVDGGLKAKHVKLQYKTKNGKPDVFYVMIQSKVNKTIAVKKPAQ